MVAFARLAATGFTDGCVKICDADEPTVFVRKNIQPRLVDINRQSEWLGRRNAPKVSWNLLRLEGVLLALDAGRSLSTKPREQISLLRWRGVAEADNRPRFGQPQVTLHQMCKAVIRITLEQFANRFSR